MVSPSARPSSIGRPGLSPCQNGIFPGCPGAGETITRSSVMSSIRHELAPSTNTSPRRLSYTHSSSSSPTRRPSVVNAPKSPRSGIVPADAIAIRPAPSRARSRSVFRSHTIRGPELREPVRRVPPAQQVEDVVEQLVTEIGEVGRATDDPPEVLERPLVHRAHRDELLRENVERVARVARLLDRPSSIR